MGPLQVEVFFLEWRVDVRYFENYLSQEQALGLVLPIDWPARRVVAVDSHLKKKKEIGILNYILKLFT
jgi:hypothetical protein